MGIYDNLLIRDIADRLKVSGSTMVPKYFGDVKGSSIEYSTSELIGTSGDINQSELSKLHNEASTVDNPKVNSILDANSYTQRYNKTKLNPLVPNPSKIDEGSEAVFIPPSSPSAQGKKINLTKDSIPSYSSFNTYFSQFDSYQSIDPNIASKF